MYFTMIFRWCWRPVFFLLLFFFIFCTVNNIIYKHAFVKFHFLYLSYTDLNVKVIFWSTSGSVLLGFQCCNANHTLKNLCTLIVKLQPLKKTKQKEMHIVFHWQTWEIIPLTPIFFWSRCVSCCIYSSVLGCIYSRINQRPELLDNRFVNILCMNNVMNRIPSQR